MTKRRKLLILSLFMCLSTTLVFGAKSNAEGTSGEQASAVSGLKDENAQRLEKVTGMDENGNVYEVDDSSGKFENGGNAQYFRSASNELVVNFNTKGNAVTNFTEAVTGDAGYTNGAFGADGAYLGMENGKVKFMMSGVIGLVAESDVQVIRLSEAKVVSGYYISGGRLMHGIVGNMTTPGYASRLDNGPAPSYLKSGVTYYSYDGHYFYTSYGTMLTDYQNNTRSHSVNPGSPYYNYFQYLPLRSQTGYDAGKLTSLINGKATNSSSKMKNTGTQFVNQQNTYGVNALIMAGIAANESGWGTSDICKSKNNLFGLNAVDSSPGTSASTYASIDECIRQFANGWMSRGYLYPNDSRYKGGFLGSKGSGINVKYASDPFWGEKAAAVMWSLDSSGGSKDYGRYTIGIKDTLSSSHTGVNVRSSNSTSSAALYNTGSSSNYAVLLKESQASNSFYKIQSDAVLNSGRTAVKPGSGEYSFDNMYAYISSQYITVVSKGSTTVAPKKLESITISTPPSKTVYTEGEKFSAAGMTVKANWSDGTQSDVTKDVTYPTGALTTGTASVTIQYSADGVTKTAAQKITVKEKVAVTSVSVNPSTVEMKAGASKTFGVSVVGTGNPAQTVTWSVEGAKDTDTKIDSTGKLQISENETAENLTVKAVSTVDTSKTATAAIKVVRETVEDPDAEKPGSNTSGGNAPDNNTPDPDTPNGEEPDNDAGTDTSPNGGSGNKDGQTAEVKDDKSGISVHGVIPEGAVLKVDVIGKDADNYAELTEPVKTNTILGVYDISLDKELGENEAVEVSFSVDESYNGKDVVVLHYAEIDGKTYLETYKSVVKDGVVSVEVSGFSPYVIALDDAGTNVVEEERNPIQLVGGQNNMLLGSKNEGALQNESESTLESGSVFSVTGSSQTAGGSSTVQNKNGAQTPSDESVTGAKAGTGDKTDSSLEQVKISDKDNGTKTVKTGDESKIIVWIVLLIFSAVVLGLILKRVKRK